MTELIDAMSNYMDIFPYQNETQTSYLYRIIYSGLGQWCLKSATSSKGPVSKQSQFMTINRLLEKYIELYPLIADSLNSDTIQLATFIRRVYEETGYLITDSSNRNTVANYGRTLNFGNKNLYFGTNLYSKIEGLGVFVSEEYQASTWRDILIRDNLDWRQYIGSQYEIVNFDVRNVDQNELQFFNPLLCCAPYASWSSKMKTNMSVARKSLTGPFYKVLKYNDEVLFCEESANNGKDELTAYEYRRLYIALKRYYNSPIRAQILLLDDEYSKIILDGYLPGREYYFMLLCSWPDMYFTNKKEFIAKNDTIEYLKDILINLGIKIIGG